MSFDIPLIGVVLYVVLAAIVYKKISKSERYCGICGSEFLNKVYSYNDGQRKLKICASCSSELRKKISKETVKNIK
jgi:rRNA maturation endonuclease Nob1